MRNLWRALDMRAELDAKRLALRRRRRWQAPPQADPDPLGPLRDLRKEVMPILTQISKLEGDFAGAQMMLKPVGPRRPAR